MVYNVDKSWIFKIWRSLSSDLKSKCQEKNLKIEYISDEVDDGFFVDKFIIKRKD